MNRQSTENVQGSENALYITMMDVTILLFKPIESTSSEPYGKLQIYRLRVIMIYQCTFIHNIFKKKYHSGK